MNIDGKEFNDITSYKIDGYYYFSISDLCDIFHFSYKWNEAENTIILIIDKTIKDPNFIIIEENFSFNPTKIDDLKKFLEKHIKGFEIDLFETEFVNNTVYGKNFYEVVFVAQIDKYKLPYTITVFIEDNKVEYSKTFHSSDILKIKNFKNKLENININSEIEKAKKEALNNIPKNVIVDYQEVNCYIDNELILQLHIKTVCVDKDGASRFVLDYDYEFAKKYNLNDF